MSTSPSACLIIIGNEILSGRTQDRNLSWLGARLGEIGIRLMEARVVADEETAIIEAVNQCRAIYTYVFTTGGIGPTHDDITTASIARAFGVPVIRHPEAEARLRGHYRPDDLNPARLKMADVPEGAELIDNPVSAAPGYRIGNVFVLAGVPVIMQAMFAHLKHQLTGGAPILSRSVTAHVTEGTIAAGLTELQRQFPELDLGSYPFFKEGKLGTTLVARGTDAAKLDACEKALAALLKAHCKELSV